MSYRMEIGEKISKSVKRIADEQVEKALDQLNDPGDDRDEAVHDARKRFKKVRAVLRLVRDEIGSKVYQRENKAYRDAGRRLSDVRDAAVFVETFDNLAARYSDQLSGEAFVELRANLVTRQERVRSRVLDEKSAMDEVALEIAGARRRIEDWPVDKKGTKAFADGLRRVYKRGRKRMAGAYDERTPEAFHEWRKRVKYLWYHTRILRPVWTPVIKALADEVHELANILGDDHDLAEFKNLLEDEPELLRGEEAREVLFALIDRRRVELETLARPLGERIYAEKIPDFVDRVTAYYDAWWAETAQ